jgi:hypothetical protein
MPEVGAPIPATSEGLLDSPVSAPAQQPVDTGLSDIAVSTPAPSEDVIEEPTPCPESQGQTSIEPTNITATEDPHVDTSTVNASDVGTPDQAEGLKSGRVKADVVPETSSRPEHRCSLQPCRKVNECVQEQPRSVLATSSSLIAKSKTKVG